MALSISLSGMLGEGRTHEYCKADVVLSSTIIMVPCNMTFVNLFKKGTLSQKSQDHQPYEYITDHMPSIPNSCITIDHMPYTVVVRNYYPPSPPQLSSLYNGRSSMVLEVPRHHLFEYYLPARDALCKKLCSVNLLYPCYGETSD